MKKAKFLVFALGISLSAAPALSFAIAPQHHDDQGDHGNHGHEDYHFRAQDRGHLQQHYSRMHEHVDRSHRWHFERGSRLPGDWHSRMRPLPREDIRLLPPPPPGYVFGYYDGYAVVYNPATLVVLDALDLLNQ